MENESRIAVVSIIVQDNDSYQSVNEALHEYSKYIIGRMGIPYTNKNVSVISVVMDAPTTVTNELSDKLDMLSGVMSKTVTANE